MENDKLNARKSQLVAGANERHHVMSDRE